MKAIPKASVKTLVIIPAYNEEANIVPVASRLLASYPQVDILVINDGSSDRTAELCRAHGLPLLDLATNLGLTGAVTAGMRYACKYGYDIAIQFDGDGQHRPEYVPALIEQIAQGADIVCGSRFLQKPKDFSPRMLGSGLISAAIRLSTGTRLSDPTSGLRAYARRVVKLFATQTDITPEPDTISYLIKLGAKVVEVPVEMDERRAGRSYLTLTRSIKYMTRMFISILILQAARHGEL